MDEFEPYVKIAVYGANNVGKTRFGATAPDVLIVDINEGEGTRSTVGSGARKIEIDEWDDVAHVYWYLKSGKHKYQSVVLDTVTGMNRLALDFVISDADRRNPGRPGKQPDKRDYGRAGELMSGMMFAFRSLPLHVVFLAHERVIRDEDTGMEVETTINLPAGSRAALMDMVSIMGYMTVKRARTKSGKVRNVPRLITAPHATYRTKDRTGRLPGIITNPKVSMMIDAWNNHQNDEEA